MSLSPLDSNIFMPASRLAYLSQIQVIVQQHKLVAIEGASGIGKTAMLEEALTNVLPDANKCYITASKNINDIQIRSRIIEQLFGNVLFDPEKPLLSSFLEFNQQTQLLIAIDNSHYLSSKIIGELLQVFSELNTAGINLVIMLAFDKAVSSTLLNLNSSIVVVAPVPALSKQESYQFLVEHFDGIPAQNNNKVKRWIDNSAGLPIQLLAFNQNTNLTLKDSSSLNLKLWGSVVITASLLIALGLYMYRLYVAEVDTFPAKPDLTSSTTTERETPPVTKGITKPTSMVVATPASPEEIFTAISQAHANAEHLVQEQEDFVELPETNVVKANKPVVHEERQQTATDTMVEEQSVIDNQVIEVNTLAKETLPEPVNAVKSINVSEQLVVTSDEAVPIGQQSSYYNIDNQAFLSLPADHYVLQLTAVSSEKTLAKYLLTAPVAIDDLRIYKIKRNKKDWIVVTHGLFPSIKAARSVATKVEPNAWAKSVAAIQQEINRFTQSQYQQ